MIVAEHFGYVVGIDTHAKTHTLAIINTATGGERANETFPATPTGGTRALSWILRRTEASPEQVLLSMEGTGSYGAKLRQQATAAGFQVIEAPVPNQRLGRYQGKSDSMDATRAARATLSIPMDRLREPRSGQNHMALRILSNARSMHAARYVGGYAIDNPLRGPCGLRMCLDWEPVQSFKVGVTPKRLDQFLAPENLRSQQVPVGPNDPCPVLWPPKFRSPIRKTWLQKRRQ
ncbi:transposase [Paenarthrobacter sp. MMS21-TAE1-1]|uniref:Transposase n=1 Tax=Paenarthrobacter aromaticivorans TaxID=2849150 RepID=A0ABS6IBP5_9MICC|nr:transposase [Paenarthrobacter sp. MMS21-TAE1-1]